MNIIIVNTLSFIIFHRCQPVAGNGHKKITLVYRVLQVLNITYC